MVSVPIEYSAVAVGVAALTCYGIILWNLGQRNRALVYFEMAANVLVMLGFVALIFQVADKLVEILFKESFGIGGLPGAEAVKIASERLARAHSLAVHWIKYIAAVRAALSLMPFLSSLSLVLGAATDWCVYSLSVAASTFLALSVLSRILSHLMPPFLVFSATLTTLPRLRKIGASLLSVYLVMGVALCIAGSIAHDTCERLDSQGLTPPISDWDTLVSSINPLVWREVPDKAAKATWELFGAAINCMLSVIVGTALTAAASIALGGVYISLRV